MLLAELRTLLARELALDKTLLCEAFVADPPTELDADARIEDAEEAADWLMVEATLDAEETEETKEDCWERAGPVFMAGFGRVVVWSWARTKRGERRTRAVLVNFMVTVRL